MKRTWEDRKRLTSCACMYMYLYISTVVIYITKKIDAINPQDIKSPIIGEELTPSAPRHISYKLAIARINGTYNTCTDT